MKIIFKVDSENFIVDFYESMQIAKQHQNNHFQFVEKEIPDPDEQYLPNDVDSYLRMYLNMDIRNI